MTERRSPFRDRPTMHYFDNPGPNAPLYREPPPKTERTGMRPLGWVIIAWNVLMGVWLVSVLADSSVTGSCLTDACRTGANAGKGIAVVAILFVAACGDAILGAIYYVTGRRGAAAASPAAFRQAQPRRSSVDELAKLVEMHDAGVLTDVEFDAAKRQALGL